MSRNWFFILTTLFCLSLSGQNLICEKLENYSSITFTDYFYKKSYFAFCGDTLFAFDGVQASSFLPRQKPKLYDLGAELSKDVYKMINPQFGFTYFYRDNQLFLKNRNNVFIFRFEKQKFHFKQQIQLKSKYGSSIFYTNNTLYFYEIYNSYKQPDRLSSGFLEYNIKTGEEKIHILPFNSLAITHMSPNQFLDFTDKGYVLCDPLRYKLYEYAYDHTLKDSIYLPDSLFKVSDPKRFQETFPSEKVAPNPSSFFEAMTTYLDSTDRIWTVNYIDDKTLFVRLTRNSLKTKGTKGQLFYDHIWVKKKEGWKLVQVKEISSFQTSQPITEKDLWPHFFPGSRYTCTKGSLYYTAWSSSQNTFPQIADSFFGFDTKDRNSLSLKLIQFKVK